MKKLLILVLALLKLAGCGGRQADVPENSETAPETQEQSDGESAGEDKYLPESSPGQDDAQAAEDAAAREAAQQKAAELDAQREAKIRALLEKMTLEQKVGQLFFVRCPEAAAADKIAQYHLGGVLLFTRDYKDAAGNWLTADQLTTKLGNYQLTAAYDTGIPLFIGSDEEGGTVTRASRNPNLFPAVSPSPQQLYNAGGIGAVLNDAAQKNDLLKKYGINVNFAPVCDVSTDPGDFIYDRALGRNAAETMAYAAGVVKVMNGEGVGAVLKHFPGYGNNADTHTGVVVDERSMDWFTKSDFIPFIGGIRSGAPFVLVSHNIVKCMDDKLPASLSPAVHEQLRGLGFTGVALTDDLAMDAVKAYAEDGSVAVLALRAGNDMVVTTDFETQIPQVIAAVRDGTLDESLIDDACVRVLKAKMQLGLMK